MPSVCRSPRIVVPLFALALLAGATPGRAVTVESIPSPRPTGWSVDLTGTIPAATRAEIDRWGDQIKAATGAELAVVVIGSTEGVPSRDFAVRLANHWGVGEKGKDNGVLLFAALDDHSAEIVLGTGLDTPANNQASEEIMLGEMIPRFRSGDPGGALREGAGACAGRILGVDVARHETAPLPAETESPRPLVGAPEEAPSTMSETGRSTPSPFGGRFAVTVLFLGLVSAGYFFLLLRAPRCQNCRIAMTKLAEEADDAHLTPVEKTEERVDSVDHQVWVCPHCGETKKMSNIRFSSVRERCAACGATAVQVTSRIVLSATSDRPGTRRYETSCAHCGRQDAYTEVIPQLPDLSSSFFYDTSSGSSAAGHSSFSSPAGDSSSSRSNFGGGHSSGGGASGKW